VSSTHTKALFCALALAGCNRDELAFPHGFVLGTSISGFQVDMGCPTIAASECEDKNSDWYAFVTSTVTRAQTTNHLSADLPSNGPGYYELFEQDMDRVKSDGLGALRFSIEWSRIFPESTVGIEGYDALKAKASATGVDYYHRQLAALKARGLTPLVTLNHYTLPLWIEDAVGCNIDFSHCTKRGWLDAGTVTEIAKYAGFVAREYGGEIDTWATLNEPLAVVLAGYVFPSADRTNPPAVSFKFAEAKTAFFNMVRAHAAMVDAVRENDTIDADGDGKPVQIGVVFPIAPIQPKDPSSALDIYGAHNVSYVYNEAFLNGAVLGKIDQNLDRTGTIDPTLVGKSDYIGLNYYFGIVVEGEMDSIAPDFSPLLTFNPLTYAQTGFRPEGIHEALDLLKTDYPGLPVIVTENGSVAGSDGDVDLQEQSLVEHLEWVLRAIDEGVDVRGYYWWTLMDNFEWNHGMSMKFGLYAVDPTDPMKTRSARTVAASFGSIAKAQRIPSSLAGKYPIR
jgi:beta-glucosidase/6-phospho-beta-glucosidase/beta-galactosidase